MLTQKWTLTAIAAGAAVTAAAAVMLTGASTRHVSLPEVTAPAQSSAAETGLGMQARADEEPEPAPPATTYLLSLNGDVLSVYASDQKEPIEQHTVPAGLPDYDRILLEYGMQVGTEAELRALMEDYLS